jgi:NTE family protein
VLWRFSKPYAGDYVVGKIDNPTIPLARAVAASSAFPPVLSPLLLTGLASQFTSWSQGAGPIPSADLGAYRERVILSDGGVYDNHGLEPVQKRYTTLFVSDGGAPFTRSAQMNTDWISQLRRLLDVTDNQVRALRRRSLIDCLEQGNDITDDAAIVDGHLSARRGAYWGIDTDPTKVDPPGALASTPAVVHALARTSTRLADPGEQTAKQLVNWGYVISDRCMRAHYKGAVLPAAPSLPFPDAPLT